MGYKDKITVSGVLLTAYLLWNTQYCTILYKLLFKLFYFHRVLLPNLW